jgi:ubiquinone/menaquinone biosynthesis C-methylase UbiE
MNPQESIKSTVQRQFGRTAHSYVTSEGHAKGEDLHLMIEWLQPKQDWHCLDIATGGGHAAKALSPHVAGVVASDLTPVMLETARSHLDGAGCKNVQYVIADAEQLPFLDATFDLVTCRIAPHHFPDPRSFVLESSRVLKPGGKFVLIDNVAPGDVACAEFINTLEKIRDESHVRCLSIREWSQWLHEANLSIVEACENRKTHQFQPWVHRMATSDNQVGQVEDYILSAGREIETYFGVEILEGHVTSFQTDTWMVMSERKHT